VKGGCADDRVGDRPAAGDVGQRVGVSRIVGVQTSGTQPPDGQALAR
jgi:hypothetical protein